VATAAANAAARSMTGCRFLSAVRLTVDR